MNTLSEVVPRLLVIQVQIQAVCCHSTLYLGHDEDVSAYGKFEVFKAKEKLNQPSQIEAL